MIAAPPTAASSAEIGIAVRSDPPVTAAAALDSDPNVMTDNTANISFTVEHGDLAAGFAKADVNIVRFGVEHEFGDGLTLRNKTLYGHYDKFYQNVFPNGAVTNGEVVLGAYNSRNDRRNLFSQTDLVWENRLAGIDQTLLFGFEVGQQKSRNHRQSGTILGLADSRVSLENPTIDLPVTFASAGSDSNNRTSATVAALYVQNQIRPASWIEIVAGLRFDSFRLKVDDLRAGSSDFSRTDKLWSPRLGLILKPADNLSVYGSFSRSYLPQSGDQFSGLTPVTDALKPERFDNYEIGAKWEPVEGLLATVAVYQLDRTNTQARDANDRVVLTGESRARGIELGLERSITSHWQISAGYALQDAEILSFEDENDEWDGIWDARARLAVTGEHLYGDGGAYRCRPPSRRSIASPKE